MKTKKLISISACMILACGLFAADYVIDGENLVSGSIALDTTYDGDASNNSISFNNSSRLEAPTAIRSRFIYQIYGDSTTHTIIGNIGIGSSGEGVQFQSGNYDFYAHPSNGKIITISNSAYDNSEATKIAEGVSIKFNNSVVFEATYASQAVAIDGSITLTLTNRANYSTISSYSQNFEPTAVVGENATLHIELDNMFTAEAFETYYFGDIAELFDGVNITFQDGRVYDNSKYTFIDGQVMFLEAITVPEPAACAALFGVLAMGYAIFRRKNCVNAARM